jgi:hypothetical protein
MASTLKRISGPAYLAAAAADVYTPPASTIFTVIKHIRLVNKDVSARTVTLFVGATGGSAGGTEILKDYSIAVGGEKDLYFNPGLRMSSTDFLTGLASAANAVTITVMGEQGVV